MAAIKVSIRSLARTLQVSHQALCQAARDGTWVQGVALNAATGRLEVTDAAAAIAEWRAFHPPRFRPPPALPPRGGDATGIARLAAPEPPDRFPRMSRADLITAWQAENTIALITVCDAIEDAEAADRAARLDRIIAAIASLAAELGEPSIASDALDTLVHHVAALDFEQDELDALTAQIDAARR